MADVTCIGHDSAGSPGTSMHGVTGREPTYLRYSCLYPDLHVTAKGWAIAVDAEGKALELHALSLLAPQMRAFHLAWMSFFTCFIATFAAAPLMPLIRNDLDLTDADVSAAGIAAVTGSVFSRLCMGAACDLVGPRYACAALLLLTAPATFCMATVSSPAAFSAARFGIGVSLAAFVSCQFWIASMFSQRIIGLANGAATGLGNLGGGATQLLMPVIVDVIPAAIPTLPSFTAWRLAFFFPGFLQVTMGFLVLVLGQDSPHGNVTTIRPQTEVSPKAVESANGILKVVVNGVRNYRSWVLAATYGYSFGVELTVDNIIASYFYDKFGVSLNTAGLIASSFGLANFVTCPLGGTMSDVVARGFGMRGRLWMLWALQTCAGVLCILLGQAGSSLAMSVCLLLLFSVFEQGACGATYGIIPFISRRSLGVISGMVGAGGNSGSIVTQLLFFTDSAMGKDTGISLMGGMIVGSAVLLTSVYFPQWGGMLFGPAKETVSEEAYYAGEWAEDEKQHGLHHDSLVFARNTRAKRGASALLEPLLPDSASGA